MKAFVRLAAGAALVLTMQTAAFAKDLVVGVSWSNFQEERWKTDEAAIKKALEAAGAKYISADAQSSAAKQLTDVESLISQGANALIVLAQDSDAIGPAVEKAADEGIPVVGYDRLIENPDAFYITFDNKEVGRMQARGVLEGQAGGQLRLHQGLLVRSERGLPVLRPDGSAEGGHRRRQDQERRRSLHRRLAARQTPRSNMEQFLTANNNKVDAVVASNDGTAGGAIAALDAQGLAGSVPVSGQDADKAALNRIALGTQTVSVWKDARELGKRAAEIAVAARQGHEDGRRSRASKTFNGGPKRRCHAVDLPEAGRDHQGQPQRRHRRRLDHQGRSLPGREGRHRCRLQVSLT